jgi:flagellar FliL protein
MAKEKEEEKSTKTNNNKILMIILIVLVVALFTVVGFLGYMMISQKNTTNATNNTTPTEQKKEKAEATQNGEYYSAKIDNLVLNIVNSKGREKLMKLSFSLKSTEPSIESIVEANNAEIVDAVIAQISARTSEELLTVGGKALLKEEMLEEINSIINEATIANDDIKRNNVKKIFFTSFVIK